MTPGQRDYLNALILNYHDACRRLDQVAPRPRSVEDNQRAIERMRADREIVKPAWRAIVDYVDGLIEEART